MKKNSNNNPVNPPALIGGSELKRTEIPNLLEMFATSKTEDGISLLTLTDLSQNEIILLNRCQEYSERYDLDLGRRYINRHILLKISKNRRGRMEFMSTLRKAPEYDRFMKYIDQEEKGNTKVVI